MADCKRKTANLFSDKLIGMTWWDGVITADERFTLYIAEVKPNTEYTASGNNSVDNIMVTYYSVYPAEGQSSVESVRYVYPTNPTRSVATFTAPDDSRIKYAAVRFGSDATEVMFNLGSTAFPYEPNGWVHSLRKLSTDTDTITTLPADIYPNDTTATVGLKGQTVQNGTPAPDNPVMPNGTGERTGNLFDMSTVENGKSIAMDGSITNYVRRCSTVTPIDVSTYDNVTLSFTATLLRTRVIYALFNDSTLLTRQIAIFSGTTIDVSSGNKLYICFYDTVDTETIQKSDLSNVMLNLGSTPLPYEPYGYKLDISSASTTTPVYLGEVESTRRIEKLVFDGTESWTQNPNATKDNTIYMYINKTFNYVGNEALSSHFVYNSRAYTEDVESFQFATPSPSLRFRVNKTLANDVNEWKTYLQQQYAAGTPVTVWYVLATPETAVVNEPIRKIGEYADEITNVSIPVTAGGDTLSVDTTVQPSEVTVNYKGWHPVLNAHERSGGQWD